MYDFAFILELSYGQSFSVSADKREFMLRKASHDFPGFPLDRDFRLEAAALLYNLIGNYTVLADEKFGVQTGELILNFGYFLFIHVVDMQEMTGFHRLPLC